MLLLVGCNPTEAHPVIGMRIKRAVFAKRRPPDRRRSAQDRAGPAGRPLVAAAAGHQRGLAQRPGPRDHPRPPARRGVHRRPDRAIRGVCRKRAQLPARAGGGDHGRSRRRNIEAAARLYAQADRAMILYGLGVTEHTDGSLGVMGCANLALLTGNVGRKGAGVNPLRGQNNVQGACDMGALPNVLPGYQSVEDEQVRAKFERAWGCTLPTRKGLKFTEAWPLARQRARAGGLHRRPQPRRNRPPQPARRRGTSRRWTSSSSTRSSSRKTAQTRPRRAPRRQPSPRRKARSSTPTGGCNACGRSWIRRRAARPTWRSSASWPSGWATPCRPATAAEIMDEIAALVPVMAGISYPRLERAAAGLALPRPVRSRHAASVRAGLSPAAGPPSNASTLPNRRSSRCGLPA